MKIIYSIVFLFLLVPSVGAETVWCKMFGKGCITQEQIDKQSRHCQKYSAQRYYDALNEAIADPWKWREEGRNSAQDYAEARRRLALSVCFKTSNPHQF
jgi:hypothetical protein